ncbi:winged helix-turn-helix domain-containing protein [Caulobacter segnis]
MQVLTETPRMAFGDVTIDVDSRRVRAPGGACNLEPRTFDLLMTLAERPGLTASRDHLIETLWSRDEGSHGALNKTVADLRKALGDDDQAPRFIETVPAIGYRWIYEAAPGSTPPAQRWSLGPSWVAVGAMLAIAVGGAASVGAYAWAQDDDPPPRAVAAR